MAKSMATAESLKQEMDPQDIEQLRTLVPLRTLDDEAFARLLENVRLQTLRRDEVLFRQGDTEQVSYYLLDGSVAMIAGEHVVDMLNARSESARFPIAHLLPRKHTARAAGTVKVALIDSRQVSQLLAEAHRVEYQVADVLEATEGTIQLVACDDDEPCQWSSQCVTRKVWDAANDALQEVFASRTIGQLANERLQLAAAGALMFHI